MNIRIEIHNRAIATRKANIRNWNISIEDKKALARFLEELELGKVNRGKRLSESRQAKYLDVLKTPLEYFGKPTQKLTIKDIETFEKDLTSGAIKSNRGTPYLHATRVDMRSALRVYLRWKLGTEKANKLTGWLDTRRAARTPDFLKESDVEKLYRACKSPEERFLIAVLFDTGARAGEFHNIRYEDIHLPEGRDNYVTIALKEEYSKTKGRTVSLYWKYSAEAVKEYVKQRIQEGIRSNEAIFKNSYNGARLFLRRLGKKMLGRSIYCHLFRHSSATYYASRMNRQQLCIRYGWTFSSNMPDIYISRAGLDNKELDEKFTNTELGSLKDDLIRLQQETKLKDERILHLEQSLGNMERNFHQITEVLRMKPTMTGVKTALRRKRQAAHSDGNP